MIKLVGIVASIALFGGSMMSDCYSCLPPDVAQTDVVKVVTETSSAGIVTRRQVTVKDTLKALNAKCKKGQLLDGNGRPLRFYKLKGCWGNPPANYQEILDKQKTEIEELNRRFTVVEMTCNPGGMPPQSIS